MPKILARFLFVLVCICFTSAWAYQVETIDGAVHVTNGATPAEGQKQMELKELWRTGGDDDDVFYGTVGGITTDKSGAVYILDTQQSQVQVYTPDGIWTDTLSRQGDGPGEVRNPDSFFLDNEGCVCMPQAPVGAIVRVNRDNTPAPVITFSSGEGTDGGLTIPLGGSVVGSVAGSNLLFAGMRLYFGNDGRSRQHYFLSLCNASGLEQSVLLQKDNFIDYSDFRMSEINMDFAWNRWAAGQDMKIYVAPHRNEYLINVYDTDGNLEKVITREYESFQRDDYLKLRATKIVEGVAAYHRTPLQGLTIEDVEVDIRGLWVDASGYLWVGTSRGLAEKPAGAYAVMDVFDPDGKFVRQVALMSDADPYKDSLQFLDDGRVVITLGSLDAWLTQQAVGQEAESDENVKTLEVIVYATD